MASRHHRAWDSDRGSLLDSTDTLERLTAEGVIGKATAQRPVTAGRPRPRPQRPVFDGSATSGAPTVPRSSTSTLRQISPPRLAGVALWDGCDCASAWPTESPRRTLQRPQSRPNESGSPTPSVTGSVLGRHPPSRTRTATVTNSAGHLARAHALRGRRRHLASPHWRSATPAW